MRRRLFDIALCLVFACHGNSNNAPSGDAANGSDGGIDAASSDAAIHDAPVDANGGSGSGSGGLPANAPPTGECENGWCWVYPLPQGSPLEGVWGTSPSDVWAFAFQSTGSRASYLHYDGATWTVSDQPSTCAASGGPSWGTLPTRGTGPCPSYWNKSWNASSGTPPVGGAAVGGLGANDYWTGSKGSTQHWDGTQWTTYAAPTSTWNPLAFGGSGATTIMISDGGGIAQWLGTIWGVSDAGTHAGNAAVVIDATHAVIAQNAGAIALWTNGAWSTTTAPISFDWSFVTATSPTDVWVAGSYHLITQLYHWDGMTWTHADSIASPIEGMWEDAAGAIWISTGDARVLVWNGSTWTAKTTGSAAVTYVWGTDWNDIWTAQADFPSNGTMHWNGSAWSQVAFPFPPDNGTGNGYTVKGIWGSAPNDYWIAGGQAVNEEVISRALFHWDGTAWTETGTYGTESYEVSAGFSSIVGFAANDIYALASTALYHYDGTSWTSINAIAGGDAVFGSSGSDVYVASGATLNHWDGTSWTTKTMTSGTYHGWANSPTDVWMNSLHYDGTFFVPLSTPTTGPILGSAGDMFSFVTAVPGNEVVEWTNGATGAAQVRSAFTSPVSAWRTPDGHIFVAGTNSLFGGLLVH